MHVYRLSCRKTFAQWLFLRSSSSSSRRRHTRNDVLRRNRRDPELEEAARKGKLLVPLDKVCSEWRQSRDGLQHLDTVASHSRIYESLFGQTFPSCGYMGVAYEGNVEVHRGNILYPRQVLHPPTLTLPQSPLATDELGKDGGTGLYTVTLTNPDGHFWNPTKEVLHWMITNIPSNSPTASAGNTLYPYVPPLPPQGTGVHRLVFTLYSHSSPIDSVEPITESIGSWMDKRTFSSRSFLSSNPSLTPFTIAFFQTLWDTSVSQTYSSLGLQEPMYGLKKELTPRKLTQRAVKEARRNRYVYL